MRSKGRQRRPSKRRLTPLLRRAAPWPPRQPYSPDPLSNYVWDIDALADPFLYQSYDDLPIAVTTDSPRSFEGLGSLTKPGGSATVCKAPPPPPPPLFPPPPPLFWWHRDLGG